MIVRRIGVMSLAKLTGAIYGVLGLVFGVIFGVVMVVAALVQGAMGSGDQAIADMTGALVGGIVFAVLVPIMYLVIGFVGGLLTAWLYNTFAARFGGVELELSER
jgi:hypothetical protein